MADQANQIEHKKTRMTTNQVDGICPICRIGTLKFETSIMQGIRRIFIHKCDNCGEKSTLDRKYPYMEHVEAGVQP